MLFVALIAIVLGGLLIYAGYGNYNPADLVQGRRVTPWK